MPATILSNHPPRTAEISALGASETDWLIAVEGVRKKYCRDLRRSLWYSVSDVLSALTVRPAAGDVLRTHEFWAVDDVSFQLRRGDSLGLLGYNGAGKSTLLKLVSGQRQPSAGTITTRGCIVAMTELGLGFDPTLTGRENAYFNAAVQGMMRRDFDGIIEQVIDFSGIREFIDSAVHTYSSGMKARLGFSVAAHLNPDILIIDEVLSVGDLEFKRKCIQHVIAYVRQGGAVLLVSHEPYLVQSICNRSIVLDRGKVVFEGSGVEGVDFHFQLGRDKHQDSLGGEDLTFGRSAFRSDPTAQKQSAPFTRESDLASARTRATASAPPPPSPALSDARPVIVDGIDVVPLGEGGLRTGHSAKVVLRYRSKIRAEIIWGFSICTSDMRTNIASCSKGMDGDASHLQEGEHSLVCCVPDLPLQPGVYAIRGGIGDAASQVAIAVLGYEDQPQLFTVAAAGANRTNNLKMAGNDLVTIKVEWTS